MNNPKLFLFCIGGTGSRVLKALTYLLASGVEIKASQIVPIIIDPDSANGDVQRTIEVLKNYQEIRSRLEFQENGFFKADIQTLASIQETEDANQNSNGQIADTFSFDIDGTRAGIFKTFIGYGEMSPADQAMTDLLFSKRNLDMDLNVGFKGNPHMGSVVLNQFNDSKEYRAFASRFNEGDRVFIVSSIFGGTGAAGFPLLVKNIREASDQQRISNHNRLRNAAIGAVTVTPYFGVDGSGDHNMTVDKNTFISKTKAALEYYERNLTQNRSLNALYYIGDPVTKDQPAAEGKAEQKNEAHAIELFSALAIIDYMDLPQVQVSCSEGKAASPVYKEYGIRGDHRVLQMNHLGARSKAQITKPLFQYVLSLNFWRNELNNAIAKPENWTKNKVTPITSSFLAGEFYQQQLAMFNLRFREWLAEMARNDRAFDAFDVDTRLLHQVVKGWMPMKKGWLSGEKPDEWTYADYNYALNEIDNQLANQDPQKRFMALFYRATEKIFDKKYEKLLA